MILKTFMALDQTMLVRGYFLFFLTFLIDV